MNTNISTLCCPKDKGSLNLSADGKFLICNVCQLKYEYNDPCWIMDGDTPSDNDASAERFRNDIKALKEAQRGWGPIRQYGHDFGLLTIAEAHYKWVDPFARNAVCLDVGCGEGLLLSMLAKHAGHCIGVDPLQESLKEARNKLADASRVTLIKASGTKLPIRDYSIDVVVSSEVLEHVANPHEYLAEIYRVLKPGGVCTLSTPSGWMFYLPMPWNIKKLARKIIHPHKYFSDVSPELNWQEALPAHPALRFSVLDQWCRLAGFKVVKHRGMLWSYYTPSQFSLERFFEALSKNCPSSIKVFKSVVRLVERCLEYDLPFARMISTRQIIVLKKP